MSEGTEEAWDRLEPEDWDDAEPLGRARQFSRYWAEQPGGGRCPCCRRRVQIYRKRMTGAQARTISDLYRRYGVGLEFEIKVALTDLYEAAHPGGTQALRHLGLLKRTKAGFYSVTRVAMDWINGMISIPTEICTYDGDVVSTGGTPESFSDVLSRGGFNIDEVLDADHDGHDHRSFDQ